MQDSERCCRRSCVPTQRKNQRVLADPVNSRLRLHDHRPAALDRRARPARGALHRRLRARLLRAARRLPDRHRAVGVAQRLPADPVPVAPSPEHRRSRSGLLAYDIVQLAALLYLTGGMDNPFTMLIVAPVTVSAATLPLRNTVALGLLALAAAAVLVIAHEPLPWYPGVALRAAGDLQDRRVRRAVRVDGVHRALRVAAEEGIAADVGGAGGDRHRAGERAEAARARWACRGGGARARHAAVDDRAGDQGARAHELGPTAAFARTCSCSRRRRCAAARSCRS